MGLNRIYFVEKSGQWDQQKNYKHSSPDGLLRSQAKRTMTTRSSTSRHSFCFTVQMGAGMQGRSCAPYQRERQTCTEDASLKLSALSILWDFSTGRHAREVR